MVKQRIEYRTGTFIDYKGDTRNYIVAAVSELMDESSSIIELKDNGDLIMNNVCKKLSLGFSICNPQDKWNESLGKEIALGKALKRPSRVLYTTHIGMINTAVVDALLKQEMNYFERNPSSIIAGYEKAEKDYKNSKDSYKNTINDEQQN